MWRLMVATPVLAIGFALSVPAIAGSSSGARDVCHEHFGNDYDPFGRWMDSVVTTLCNDGNADSKLAVYLLSVPAVEGTHAQPDEALLTRAFEGVRRNDAPLLFIAAMREETDCDERAAFAKRLTDADAGNGLAWLTRASVAASCNAEPADVMSSLSTAARSQRFHDYGFDIVKRVATRLARVPVPAEIVALEHAETADQVRFDVLKQTVILKMALAWTPAVQLLGETCPHDAGEDVQVACEGVKRGLLRYGDSAALVGFDPERARAAMEDAGAVLGDHRDALVAKVAMRTLAQSGSESEFYRRTRALIGEPKAPAKAH
jgi:hypothetical protein